MSCSKLLKKEAAQAGAVSAIVTFEIERNRRMPVISAIGRHSRGKSTLLNQIIRHTAPFFVNPNVLIAKRPTTEGIDLYDDGDSIYLDTEGAQTIMNEDNNFDFMVLLSITSISNVIILLAEYLDMDEAGSFSRKLLLDLFVSNMIFNNDKKKLIIVLRDADCQGAQEIFKQFVLNEIWSIAIESYIEICKQERNIENDEYSFENYFELVVLSGEFSKKNRKYKDSVVQMTYREIKQSNRYMQMGEIEDKLNDIYRNFNENALPDPKTTLMVTSMIKRNKDSFRIDCLSKNPAAVARDVKKFIEREKNDQKRRIISYNSDFSETAIKFLDGELTKIYEDLYFEWTKILINYNRAQILYYDFKIECVNLNYRKDKGKVYEAEIRDYKIKFEREMRSIQTLQSLRAKIFRKLNQFENIIRDKISKSISRKKLIDFAIIGTGVVTTIASAGSGAALFAIEAAVARLIGALVIGFGVTSGAAASLGVYVNKKAFIAEDRIINLRFEYQVILEEEIEQLSSKFKEMNNRLNECKGGKLLMEIDAKILKTHPEEFSDLDLEVMYETSNRN